MGAEKHHYLKIKTSPSDGNKVWHTCRGYLMSLSIDPQTSVSGWPTVSLGINLQPPLSSLRSLHSSCEQWNNAKHLKAVIRKTIYCDYMPVPGLDVTAQNVPEESHTRGERGEKGGGRECENYREDLPSLRWWEEHSEADLHHSWPAAWGHPERTCVWGWTQAQQPAGYLIVRSHLSSLPSKESPLLTSDHDELCWMSTQSTLWYGNKPRQQTWRIR